MVLIICVSVTAGLRLWNDADAGSNQRPPNGKADALTTLAQCDKCISNSDIDKIKFKKEIQKHICDYHVLLCDAI